MVRAIGSDCLKPPYLFRGERPVLERVQAGIELGETFSIKTADASRITSVVLSRLPSVTHISDVDQRTIELEFTRSGSNKIRAKVPGNAAVALSGHYYLVLMSDNGQGPTPSRAAIVQIGERNLDEAPLPFGIQSARNHPRCCRRLVLLMRRYSNSLQGLPRLLK